MAWLILLFSGLMETFWATMMKLSNGFSNWFFALLTVIGLIISMGGLVIATKHLPIGIAYPIWTGIGAVGSVLVGAWFFHNHITGVTWFFVVLLIISIIGIQISANH
ncbi:DMT family transporter [Limosilactobacillus caccae]|uniref:DMT family transporter n=1 Tax=Limosilactobacillus caccae TaxID=1926284 RepID=UPI0009707413|nr:multidrug efflux SMR transporter [Limosilactobacillus caccae]